MIERLRTLDAVAVQGNHDAAVLGRIPTGTFNDLARRAVEWTAETMTEKNLEWLAGLPEKRVEGDFTLAHGSPRDPIWEYLFSVPAARINLGAFETPYCVVGHTHHQLAFVDEQGQVRAGLSESLKFVIAQRLIPATERRKQVACFEVLKNTLAVGNMIREEKTYQIPSAMQTGKKYGMQTLDDAILDHLTAKRISADDAYAKCNNKETFRPYLKNQPSDFTDA